MVRVLVLSALLMMSLPAKAETEITPFARNVTTHVLLHELAHALIREFDLPVLGNEENIADSFATLFIAETMPDQAEAIVKDRARSWLVEAEEAAPGDIDLTSEHGPDARRAYRAICWLYGSNPKAYIDLPYWIDLPRQDARACADAAPEIIRSWRRVLAPNLMPEGRPSSEYRVIYGEGPMKDAMRADGLMAEIGMIASRFDWHSQITLHFDHCDKGARWSRNGRKILLCDDYVARFIEQEARMPALFGDRFR